MRHLSTAALLCLALAACGPSGVSVYNQNDSRVGRVEVATDTSATVYDANGTRKGKIDDTLVLDRNGSRVGKITSDKRILNKNDSRIGKISGRDCYNANDSRVGKIASTIDLEAAGGACLLLLLLP